MSETAKAHLRVCVFRGLQNLPLFVAQQQGFFAHHGLDVEIIYTAGSSPQIAGLVSGEYHLVQTSPDNVIHENRNQAALNLDSATSTIIMLLGGSVGPLSLYAQPAMTSFDALRHAILGVDDPSSGFALMLRDIAARNGLLLEQDYTFALAGGTSARLDALKNASVAATMLYAPYDKLAAQAGLTLLATSSDYYAAYASLSTAAVRGWVNTHRSEAIRYIASLLQALRWIYDPLHASQVQNLLASESTLGISTALAKDAYMLFVDPDSGFGATALLDEAGLRQVIAIRSAYDLSSSPLGLPVDYMDLRCYHDAQALLA